MKICKLCFLPFEESVTSYVSFVTNEVTEKKEGGEDVKVKFEQSGYAHLRCYDAYQEKQQYYFVNNVASSNSSNINTKVSDRYSTWL